jgi:hypothetical protein
LYSISIHILCNTIVYTLPYQKDVLRGDFRPLQSGVKGVISKMRICVYTVDG